MSKAWNFERRQIVCARFIVGVSLVVKGATDAMTSLEAVRNRVRLPPEDALFAARRLDEEQKIQFDPGGAVRSTRKGIEHATEIVRVAAMNARHAEDVDRVVRGGGVPHAMLKLAVLANGGVLECEPVDGEARSTHRLRADGERLILERRVADDAFEAILDDG